MNAFSIALALLVTVVPIAVAPLSMVSLMISWLLILPVVFWIGLRVRRDGPRGARVAAALLLAYGATMLCVQLAQWPVSPHPVVFGHPPRGEVIVFVHAGLPWPGVGGSQYGLAHGRVPLRGGVDALLVNFSFWVLWAGLLMRRMPRDGVVVMFWASVCAALLGAWTGGWVLVEMFD